MPFGWMLTEIWGHTHHPVTSLPALQVSGCLFTGNGGATVTSGGALYVDLPSCDLTVSVRVRPGSVPKLNS
eukprot:364869-Chlamydomonas_euryale.AAC.21